MRINGQPGQLPTQAASNRARGTTAPQRGEDTRRDDASVVSINKNSKAMASISTDLSARLESVRAELAAGTYEIDLERLAENILANDLGIDEG